MIGMDIDAIDFLTSGKEIFERSVNVNYYILCPYREDGTIELVDIIRDVDNAGGYLVGIRVNKYPYFNDQHPLVIANGRYYILTIHSQVEVIATPNDNISMWDNQDGRLMWSSNPNILMWS